MKWSKLKAIIESRFCDTLKNRLAIYSTTYGACTCGHAWITLDQEVIANFCTRAFWNTRPTWEPQKERFIKGTQENLDNGKYNKLLNQYGELSRQDVYESCWIFIHDLSIKEALLTDNPLIQTLAIADKRVGKRRLSKMDGANLHPLARKIYKERKKLE